MQNKIDAIDGVKQAPPFVKQAIKDYLTILINEKRDVLEIASGLELPNIQGEIRSYRKLMEIF